MIVLGIAGLLTLIVGPTLGSWMRNQRLKDFTRATADLMLLARSEAARTGSRHIVLFGPAGTADPAGTTIATASGSNAAMIAVADGAPAASNCQIDASEDRRAVDFANDVQWGVSQATVRAPGDEGTAPFTPPQASGGTFADPNNVAVPWFLFRPDGVPVVFTGALGSCGTIGQTGTGGAALYTTNGERDYAVVLTPLGSVSVLVWNQDSGQWQG